MGLMESIAKYKPSFRHYALVPIIAVPLFLGCSGKSDKGTGPGEPPVEGFQLAEQTRVLDESTMNLLSSYQNGTLIFRQSNDELKGIKKGDILVGGASSFSPYGFLRKVDYVSARGDTMKTLPSSLEDAVKNGGGSFSKRLRPSDVISHTSLYGIGKPSSNYAFDFNIPLDNVVLYDRDGNPSTISDRIVADGNISFNSDIDFGFDVSLFKIKEVSFSSTINESMDLDILSGPSFEIQKEVTLSQYTFAVPIPGTPLVVFPVVEVKAGVNANAQTGLRTEINQNAQLNVGVSYKNRNWSSSSQFTNTFDYQEPEVFANASVKGKIGIESKIMAWGVAGVTGEVDGYLKLEADMTRDVTWTLKGGLEAAVGAEAGIFSIPLVNYNKSVINFEKVVAQAQPRPPLVASIHVTPNSGNVPLDVLLDASSSVGDIAKYEFTFDDGTPHYIETSFDAPDGNFDGKTRHKYYFVANYTPSVTVFDSFGRSNTAGTPLNTSSSSSQTITIKPGPEGKDAYVSYNKLATGEEFYGGEGNTPELNVRRGSSNLPSLESSLIEFPLSQIPANSTITSAKLKFWGWATSSSPSNIPTFKVSRLDGAWDESSVKWNTMPSSQTISSVDITGEGVLRQYEVDITPTFQGWVNGANYGVSISTDESNVAGKIISGDNSDSSRRPKVEVTIQSK